eukprot:5680424-Amphidinium_carterae.1
MERQGRQHSVGKRQASMPDAVHNQIASGRGPMGLAQVKRFKISSTHKQNDAPRMAGRGENG